MTEQLAAKHRQGRGLAAPAVAAVRAVPFSSKPTVSKWATVAKSKPTEATVETVRTERRTAPVSACTMEVTVAVEVAVAESSFQPKQAPTPTAAPSMPLVAAVGQRASSMERALTVLTAVLAQAVPFPQARGRATWQAATRPQTTARSRPTRLKHRHPNHQSPTSPTALLYPRTHR